VAKREVCRFGQVREGAARWGCAAAGQEQNRLACPEMGRIGLASLVERAGCQTGSNRRGASRVRRALRSPVSSALSPFIAGFDIASTELGALGRRRREIAPLSEE
jgi:hypothetical protein